MSPTKFIKIHAKLIILVYIYEHTQINSFLYAINTETKCCTCRFFNDKAISKHLLLPMKMLKEVSLWKEKR